MINEDKELRNLVGDRTPFTVPEGYFDRLQSEVMAKIPAQDMTIGQGSATKIATKRRWLLRPIAGIAALVCLLIGAGVFYYQHNITDVDTPAASAIEPTVASVYDADYGDDAADYIMMDNDDLYSYMMD